MKTTKVKIFDVSWHLGAQAEFLKLPNTEHYWMSNNVREDWNKKYRDQPTENLTYVPYFEEGKYDLAVLHIDQASLDYDPKLARGKNTLSCDVNEAIKDTPKVILNHGTPFWPELYGDPEGKYSEEWLLKQCKEFVGDNLMIVNSHRAREMWGIENSRTIIHGMEATEWLDLPKECRVITTLSPAGWDAYYNRLLMRAVQDDLKQQYKVPMYQVGTDFMAEDFNDYKNFIGRSLIYFNSTKESPMPRGRTEAMLSGACIVSSAGHGAEDYFNCNAREVFLAVGEYKFPEVMKKIIAAEVNNITGFIIPDNPEPTSWLIAYLFENYDIAKRIGQNGKRLARDKFNINRYQSEWGEVIKSLTGKDILK